MDYFFKEIDSPVGKLTLVANDRGLSAILWENDDPTRVSVSKSAKPMDHSILLETEKQLAEYFNGQRKTFSIPLEFVGTEFQKNVWQALLTIPYGETMTYGQLAAQIGNLKAVRAVGAANGKNPISIIAPCHRVIGASGSLTGFAGGLANKALLLNLENGRSDQRHSPSSSSTQQLSIFH